jgi:hypothetical protein
MNLMILAGVWSLAFGHITLTHSLKMKGNEARIFGLALIIAAAFGLPYLNGWFGHIMPKFVASNDTFRSAYDLLVSALGTYVTALVITRVVPRLRVPSVTVSLRRTSRAA